VKIKVYQKDKLRS